MEEASYEHSVSKDNSVKKQILEYVSLLFIENWKIFSIMNHKLWCCPATKWVRNLGHTPL